MGNVNKAEKMLRDHGQWRDDYGFPALLAAGKTPEDAFIERWWPDGLLEGSDLKGRPVQLIRLGKADLPGIEREVGRKKWIEYCCLKNEALFEEIRKRCLAQNTFETSAPLIMDMRDLGTHHAWGVPLFKAMLDVDRAELSGTTERDVHRERAAGGLLLAVRHGQGLPEPRDGGESASFWGVGRSPEGAARGHAAIDDTYRPRWGGGRCRRTCPWAAPCRNLGVGEPPLPKNVSVGGQVPSPSDRAVAEPEPETWGAYDTRVAEGET